MSQHNFSGSYLPEDVTFLLKVISMPETSLEERERNIQAGIMHYSEMIGKEQVPSKAYLDIFNEALTRNAPRLAKDLLQLAAQISSRKAESITLVSLARAGTPVGVLLKRILQQYFHREVRHYSVSIIRDRGIDYNALLHILVEQGHSEKSLVFVDGWTGKGAIASELQRTLALFNQLHGRTLLPELYVITDLCGLATVSASFEDYLIPSSILNSIVSGLVSRTILHEHYISQTDFHGCLYYEALQPYDLSRKFTDTLMEHVAEQAVSTLCSAPVSPQFGPMQHASNTFLERVKREFGVTDRNIIKPGIGEATRVLLRRKPDVLILQKEQDKDTHHLRLLAQEKHVPTVIWQDMPYKAAAVIKVVVQLVAK